MLVLTRKQRGRIFIGEGPEMVIVEVMDIRNGQVRIGVIAPKGVRIDREEVRAERDGVPPKRPPAVRAAHYPEAK
jgi:carbon storage regulator CsrA